MGWTKWAKRLLVNSIGFADSYGNMDHFQLQLKNTSGTLFNVYDYGTACAAGVLLFLSRPGDSSTYYNIGKVVIGSGTVEESEDDYKINTSIASAALYNYSATVGQTGLCQAQAITESLENGKQVGYIEVKGTNTTNNDISIAEIAFYQSIRNGNSYNNYTDICIYRKVLSEPIVVEPSGTYSFKIRIAE